jgi:TRAP-type C4-dicarboxylate transport system permease small subunit
MQSQTVIPDAPVAAIAVDSRTYAIDRAIEPLRWLFRWGSLVMLVAMVTLPFVQVIAREVFGAPLIGSDEFARFMLICTVFIALPYVAAGGANIRMEEILSLCPPRFVRAVRVVIALVATATFATAAVASAVAIGSNLDNATPTLGMPYWLFLGAALVSFTMTTVECVIQLVKVLQDKPLYISFPQEMEPAEELDLPPEMKI